MYVLLCSKILLLVKTNIQKCLFSNNTPFEILVKNFVWLDKTSSLRFSPHFWPTSDVPASRKKINVWPKRASLIDFTSTIVIKKHNKSQTFGINRFMIKSTFTFSLLWSKTYYKIKLFFIRKDQSYEYSGYPLRKADMKCLKSPSFINSICVLLMDILKWGSISGYVSAMEWAKRKLSEIFCHFWLFFFSNDKNIEKNEGKSLLKLC